MRNAELLDGVGEIDGSSEVEELRKKSREREK